MTSPHPLDHLHPSHALPIARVDHGGRTTQLFCQIPDREVLQDLERLTGQIALTYVPVLGWAVHALERWEREHGQACAAPWTPSARGLSVPAPVYRLDESGLVIVQEPGSVKAVLALAQGVTHMPGVFLSDPAGVDADDGAL